MKIAIGTILITCTMLNAVVLLVENKSLNNRLGIVGMFCFAIIGIINLYLI
jgi:hypothetical protein